NAVRQQRTEGRDQRRVESAGIEEGEHADPGTSPSQHALRRDLLEEVLRRLPPQERQLQQLREQGLEWAEIAAQVGGNAEALRKRLARAIDEVAEQLGLDEPEETDTASPD